MHRMSSSSSKGSETRLTACERCHGLGQLFECLQNLLTSAQVLICWNVGLFNLDFFHLLFLLLLNLLIILVIFIAVAIIKSGTGVTGEVMAVLGTGLLFRDTTASLAFGGREDEDGLERGQALALLL